MAHFGPGSTRKTNTWIIVAIVGFLVLFGIWFFTSQDGGPLEPTPPPADGSPELTPTVAPAQ